MRRVALLLHLLPSPLLVVLASISIRFIFNAFLPSCVRLCLLAAVCFQPAAGGRERGGAGKSGEGGSECLAVSSYSNQSNCRPGLFALIK